MRWSTLTFSRQKGEGIGPLSAPPLDSCLRRNDGKVGAWIGFEVWMTADKNRKYGKW